MRVFVAGATGAIGRQLTPLLVAEGHEVTGTTRSQNRAEGIAEAGAEPVMLDALDAEATLAAVGAARPDVVVHQLTAISPVVDPNRFAESFAPTNRLRREGTRNLVEAAKAAGAKRIVAQSLTQAYEPRGGWVKTEEDPLNADPPEVLREIFRALIDLEAAVLGAGGIDSVVHRYGNFYGPGTFWAPDGFNAELVRTGRFPIAGEGTAHWSFIHVADAARAVAASLARGEAGVYNIVDDEPAPVREWLPVYARALDAPEPARVGPPKSDLGAFGMLHSRGASNAKARREIGWAPAYPSWREGFVVELADSGPPHG